MRSVGRRRPVEGVMFEAVVESASNLLRKRSAQSFYTGWFYLNRTSIVSCPQRCAHNTLPFPHLCAKTPSCDRAGPVDHVVNSATVSIWVKSTSGAQTFGTVSRYFTCCHDCCEGTKGCEIVRFRVFACRRRAWRNDQRGIVIGSSSVVTTRNSTYVFSLEPLCGLSGFKPS